MQLYSHQFQAIGSPCQIQLYAKNREAFSVISSIMIEEVNRLEQKYSRYQQTSLLSEINQSAGIKSVEIDAETYSLCQYANTAYQLSNGLFDVTTGILRRIWNFKTGNIPKPDEISNYLPLINWPDVSLTSSTIYLPYKGMEIDLGGIVKEYAADAARNIAINKGCQHGIVELGGDISIIGAHTNGKPWQVGIRTGKQNNGAHIYFPATKGAIASSGNYEKVLVLDGKTYSHILNPQTGWPCDGLTAVSVWAEQCIIAGSVSTIAMLLGEEEGLQWLKESSLPFIAKTKVGSIVSNKS